jgi:hypothetical protein
MLVPVPLLLLLGTLGPHATATPGITAGLIQEMVEATRSS